MEQPEAAIAYPRIEVVVSVNAKKRVTLGGAGPWPRCKSDYDRFCELIKGQIVIAPFISYLQFRDTFHDLGARFVVLASFELTLDKISDGCTDIIAGACTVEGVIEACREYPKVFMIGCMREWYNFAPHIDTFHVTNVFGDCDDSESLGHMPDLSDVLGFCKRKIRKTSLCVFERWDVTDRRDSDPPSRKRSSPDTDIDPSHVPHKRLPVIGEKEEEEEEDSGVAIVEDAILSTVIEESERDDAILSDVIEESRAQAEYDAAMWQLTIQQNHEEALAAIAQKTKRV
jgi:hypothetical protein